MNTLSFLDANVWLALFWNRHVHSERAWLWFEQARQEQFFFCRFTQITVLRLLTTEQVMGKDTKTRSEAWKLWDQAWADSQVAFLAEPVDIEKGFSGRIHGCPAVLPRCGPMPIFWPSRRSLA